MNVFLIVAVTADGYIAEEPGQISTAWTSKEDKKFFSERTKQAKVMVMGAKTFQTIGRPLPGRLTVVYSRQEKPNIPTDQYDHTQLRTTNVEPKELLDQLAQEGFTEVAICGGSTIYTLFLKAGLVNKIYLTVEPILFGRGVKLLSEAVDVKLKLLSQKNLSVDTVLLEYSVLK